jgi:hypothetical protein
VEAAIFVKSMLTLRSDPTVWRSRFWGYAGPAVLAETRTTTPDTKIHESYGVGTHALPRGSANTGGTGSGAGG